MAPILGYWNIRGIVQPLKFLLAYVGDEYEDKVYPLGESFGAHSEWNDSKFKLGLDFPNLPYYIDGDVKLTQSISIAKYIAKKHGLDGKTEEEKVKLSVLEQQQSDFMWWGLIRVIRSGPNYDKEREEYINGALPVHLESFSKYLGPNKFFVGESITYVDFLIYEVLYAHSKFAPEIFDNYSNLRTFLKRIEALPAIEKYMKSDRYIHSPQFPIFMAYSG